MITMKSIITDEMLDQFHQRGFMILENAVDPTSLENLRNHCDSEIARMHARMDEQGTDILGINHRNKRYFLANTYQREKTMYDFIFGALMQEICRRVLGPSALLFLDQMVIKAAEQGMAFSWHQDSGYIGFDHEPYITCWTALDDVTEENGTVYLLPYDRLGIRTRVRHIRQEGSNDMVGYFGDDPGVPVIVPAGSVAVFSSVCFHRSGTNRTDRMRRVMLTQYSSAPIINPVTGKNQIKAIPFLESDKRVVKSFDELKE